MVLSSTFIELTVFHKCSTLYCNNLYLSDCITLICFYMLHLTLPIFLHSIVWLFCSKQTTLLNDIQTYNKRKQSMPCFGGVELTDKHELTIHICYTQGSYPNIKFLWHCTCLTSVFIQLYRIVLISICFTSKYIHKIPVKNLRSGGILFNRINKLKSEA